MKVNLNFSGDIASVEKGLRILAPRMGIELGWEIPVKVKLIEKGFTIKGNKSGYELGFKDKTDFYRAAAFLADSASRGEEVDISEARVFNTCGSMLDVSRGYVYKKEVIFDLIERMAIMGLNMFMLYTEDTYKMEKYPWFGYLRGGYTPEELKAIDDYADMFGIEVIPCIQTLGHLYTMLKWPAFNKIKDTGSVLRVDSKETYELIEEMIKTMRSCFRSNRINIGMDETAGLGTGAYLDYNKPASEKELFIKHIKKVYKIARKYKYHPMMWSDMFFKFSGQKGEYDLAAQIPVGISDELPKDLEVIYWDYCMEDSEVTDTVIKMHSPLERPVIFAGGIWTWNRFINCYKKSFDTAKCQLPACRANGIDTVFATIWNNRHSYNSLYSILPSLQLWAELSYDLDTDEEKLAKNFKICTGYDLKDWKSLFVDDFSDEDRKKHNPTWAYCINSSFAHFFSDILLGLLDKNHSKYDFKSKYKKHLEDIKKSDRSDMADMFERQQTFTEILYIKCDIGPRLRKAYKDGDKETLGAILEELYTLLSLHKKFNDETRDMWYKLCKPFGNNALQGELGEVEARVATAIYRIEGYLKGDFDRLEELEEEIFYYKGYEDALLDFWSPSEHKSVFE